MEDSPRHGYVRSNASFVEAVRVAFGSLRSSKLRSFLTLLGIILATATLISVMSVIHGMNVYIAQNVSDMGADGFRIVRMAFIGNFDPKKFLELQRKNPELQREEFRFLKTQSTLMRDVGMQMFRRAAITKGRTRDTTWFGMIDEEWPSLKAAYQRWLDPGNFDANGRQRTRLSELTAAALRK